MTSLLTLSYVDHDGETSNAAVRLADVNAGNFATVNAAMDAIRDAIDAVTILNRYKDQRQMAVTETAKTLPASGWAQRETKWLVTYADTVNAAGNGSFEIPGADLVQLVAGTDALDIGTGTPGEDLVTALEANVLSRLGNPIEISSIIHVGRNI